MVSMSKGLAKGSVTDAKCEQRNAVVTKRLLEAPEAESFPSKTVLARQCPIYLSEYDVDVAFLGLPTEAAALAAGRKCSSLTIVHRH